MEYKFIDLDLTEEERKYIRPLWDSYFFLNGKRIELEGKVKQYLSIGNKLLILMGDHTLTNRNRNIWCFNDQGEKEWEIMDMYDSEELSNPNTVIRTTSPYTGMSLKNGVIRVFNFSGHLGVVDLETGKVSDWKWVG